MPTHNRSAVLSNVSTTIINRVFIYWRPILFPGHIYTLWQGRPRQTLSLISFQRCGKNRPVTSFQTGSIPFLRCYSGNYPQINSHLLKLNCLFHKNSLLLSCPTSVFMFVLFLPKYGCFYFCFLFCVLWREWSHWDALFKRKQEFCLRLIHGQNCRGKYSSFVLKMFKFMANVF